MPGDARDLLFRYAPRLRYDSQENYFADAAAEFAESPTNVLQREGGESLAWATAGEGQQKLTLEFLRADKYPDPANSEVRKTDRLSHPDQISLEEYQALHKNPLYRNRMYAHLAQDGDGPRWLQYWFFYYYNEAPFQLVKYGKHEGDWEMIQLRLGDDDRPNLAVYAQHKHAGVKQWPDVEKTAGGETPVVYVARGSHASYFEPGPHHFRTDRANGEREAPPLVIEVVGDDTPSWVAWPGIWGDTEPDLVPGESSPGGPCRHKQWGRPDTLIDRAAEATPPPPTSAAPPPHPVEVSVTRDGEVGVVEFALPGNSLGTAERLLVTVNSPDDHEPPSTQALELTGASGTVPIPIRMGEEKRYEVSVSTANVDGTLSDAVTRLVRPART